jgi:DNA-binding MarR family transcriptional regulator
MAEPRFPGGEAAAGARARRGRLEEEIRQGAPVAEPAERALLNLLRSAALLGQEHARFLRPHGLTPAQYNALRILRGAHPEPLPCGEVGARLVAPVPDVTRLLDRLAARGLVRRERDPADRRVVRVGITAEGLARLAAVDAPLTAWIRARLAKLGDRELETLSELLERARAPAGERDRDAAADGDLATANRGDRATANPRGRPAVAGEAAADGGGATANRRDRATEDEGARPAADEPPPRVRVLL